MTAEERLEELNRPIENIGDIAVRLCEFLDCNNCPVTIYKCDSRTDYEKEMQHAPCCRELMEWIIRESKKEGLKPMKQEFFVATIRLDDVELYLNRVGVWGSFSVLNTLITPSLEALDYHYHRLEKCHLKDDSAVKVQKLHIDASFEEVTL